MDDFGRPFGFLANADWSIDGGGAGQASSRAKPRVLFCKVNLGPEA